MIIFISFVSCNFSKNDKLCSDLQIQTIGKVCFNTKIDSLLRTFIDKYYCDSCIYELYIDKKDPFEYKLTIRSILPIENYLQENHPVNYASIDKNLIFIYSGVEDFINVNEYHPNITTKRSDKFKRIASWSYVILKDTSYIVDNTSIDDFPFINFTQAPTVVFEAPK